MPRVPCATDSWPPGNCSRRNASRASESCWTPVVASNVGISRTDDFPPAVLGKARFSYREDPEKFIAMAPDLVLVRPMIERSYPQFIGKLRRAGIIVISLQPNSVAEMFDYWRTLGILTGRENEAETMIQTFKEQLYAVQKRLKQMPADK